MTKADIISYEKRTNFQEHSWRKTVSFEEQITFKVKIITDHIFVPSGGYCVYYPSDIFRNTRSFENWGILTRMFPSFIWGIFSQVTRLDESREKYLLDYKNK